MTTRLSGSDKHLPKEVCSKSRPRKAKERNTTPTVRNVHRRAGHYLCVLPWSMTSESSAEIRASDLVVHVGIEAVA